MQAPGGSLWLTLFLDPAFTWYLSLFAHARVASFQFLACPLWGFACLRVVVSVPAWLDVTFAADFILLIVLLSGSMFP
jgi:endonuclease/exonuclease/phosphatase (EEP) superfamily protein YafD